MKPAKRRSWVSFVVVLGLIGLSLVLRRVSYQFEFALLELRYFWWLFLILAVGGWLALMAGRGSD
jgi:hypothetical protein